MPKILKEERTTEDWELTIEYEDGKILLCKIDLMLVSVMGEEWARNCALTATVVEDDEEED